MSDAVIVGIVAAIPGVIMGIATLIQGFRTHATFNSKMDLMLKTVRDAAFAEGQKQEKDANTAAKTNFQAGQTQQKESREKTNPNP